jgi:hypothetical protein
MRSKATKRRPQDDVDNDLELSATLKKPKTNKSVVIQSPQDTSLSLNTDAKNNKTLIANNKIPFVFSKRNAEDLDKSMGELVWILEDLI